MSTESNYLSSKLTNKEYSMYSLDLVVATTAAAINATLKQYLYNYKKEPVTIWYGQSAAGAEVKPMDPIPGIDPFSSEYKTSPPKALLDSDFTFAIKTSLGWPKGVDVGLLKDVILLNEGSHEVTYNLFFTSFDIATLDWGPRGSYSWKRYSQPDAEPYFFKFKVDMNFDPANENAKFSELDLETQKLLLNYNTNTAFSVQQLYLDLNNAKLQTVPIIEGVAQNSEIYIKLQKDFVNTYWNDLNKDGKFILGYSVTSNITCPDPSKIKPTSLNFRVTPHFNACGEKTDKYNLYTLNYIMNTGGRELKLVNDTPFTWNWVSSDESLKCHGAMAVRREIFANFLNDSLSQALSDVCISPSVTFNLSNAGFKWKSTNHLEPDSSANKFNYLAEGDSKILHLDYYKKSRADDKCGAISGHFELTSKTTGDVSISGNEITVDIYAYLDIDFDNGDIAGAGKAKGNVGGYHTKTIYVITVDASGKLNISIKDTPVNEVIKGSIEEGWFAGPDGVKNLDKKLINRYEGISQRLKEYSKDVRNYVNNCNQWIFPGGKTFMFKDAFFSNYQDLVAHITYVKPNS